MSGDLSEETFGVIDRLDMAIRETVGEDSELMEKFRSILHDCGGGLEYIPHVTSVFRKERNKWIKENFKGDFDDIKVTTEKKFNIKISIGHLRRILRAHRVVNKVLE